MIDLIAIKMNVCRVRGLGFFVFDVMSSMFSGGAAEKAGVRQGDVIFKVSLFLDSSCPILRLKLRYFLC